MIIIKEEASKEAKGPPDGKAPTEEVAEWRHRPSTHLNIVLLLLLHLPLLFLLFLLTCRGFQLVRHSEVAPPTHPDPLPTKYLRWDALLFHNSYVPLGRLKRTHIYPTIMM